MKILIIGRWLLNLVKSNWKLILLAAAAALCFKLIVDYGDTRYAEGRQAVIEEMKEKIKESDDANRKKEKDVADGVNDFAKDVQEKERVRVVKEEKIVEKIVEKIRTIESPQQCDVPADVMAERNAIRALGPKGE